MARKKGPIHYVLRRFPDLTQTFVLDEILGLEASGEQVIVDSLEAPLDEPPNPALRRLRARVRYVAEHPPGEEVRRAHLPFAMRRPLTWFRMARRARAEGIWSEFRRAGVVARRCRRERARHVHTHFAYYAADIGGMAASLAGRPFTVTAHANDIWEVNNAPHLKRRLSLADAVVTPVEYNARHLRRVVPGVPVHVVRCGVPPAETAPAPADGPLLCVARLVPKKGIDLIVEALARLAPEYPELQLDLIGDGYLEEELRERAERLGLAERIHFRGSQPPEVVDAAYERCSVFVLPCRIAPDGDRDGLRVVLLEALARGLPVVTTDVVGSEVVKDRSTGLVVPAESPEALAIAIAELLSDRRLARQLGAAGRRLVRETARPEASTGALRRLFAPTAS